MFWASFCVETLAQKRHKKYKKTCFGYNLVVLVCHTTYGNWRNSNVNLWENLIETSQVHLLTYLAVTCKKLPNWDPGRKLHPDRLLHRAFHNPFAFFTFRQQLALTWPFVVAISWKKCLCKGKECALFKFGCHEWPQATPVLKLLTSRPRSAMASLLSASFIISDPIW